MMASYEDTLKRELFSWLSSLLNSNSYDYLVCVERKATAVLRMYLDFNDQIEDLGLQWDKVLSSDALPYLPDDYLKGKSVLIFNEMIHRGSSTRDTLLKIKENSESVARVEAAAFACSEEFPSADWEMEWIKHGGTPDAPHHVMHRNVSENEYEIRWRQIVSLLRSTGALLLDTEHIETTFKINMSIRDLIKYLEGVGLPIEYESGDITWPIGITIPEPLVVNPDKLLMGLPKSVDVKTSEPRKIRIVRRNNEFAFIAIWYPPLALDSVDEYIDSDSVPEYIRPALKNCKPERRPELLFHLMGLVCSIELLRSLWAALGSQVKKELIIQDFPSGSIKAREPLGHLRSLYPLLDFYRLEREILAALSMATNVSAIKKAEIERKKISGQKEYFYAEFIDERTILKEAQRILIGLVKKKMPIKIEEDWLDEDDISPGIEPFTWNDFWQEGMRLGIDETTRSVVMDYVIDNAILKTTHLASNRDGRDWIVRAYSVDNEFAYEGLVRLAYGGESLSSGKF